MAVAINEKTDKVVGALTPCQVTCRHRRSSSLYLPQTTCPSPPNWGPKLVPFPVLTFLLYHHLSLPF